MQYMRNVRSCRGFNVTYTAPCKANFPTNNSRVMLGISIDGIELHIIVGDKRTGEEDVERFTWEKIKKWKVVEADKTFSFQYFFKQTQDTWIVCETEQASAPLPLPLSLMCCFANIPNFIAVFFH